MMRSVRRLWIVGLLLVFVLPPALNSLCRAALQEKQVLNGVTDTLAALRYLYRNIGEAEQSLYLVNAAQSLTQKQYQSQKQLYDKEVAQGHEERAKVLKNNLDRLTRHLKKLSEFNFEQIYKKRIADMEARIKEVKVELGARVTEYETLFGKKPAVEMDVEKEREAARGKRGEAAYFLNLD